MQKCWFYLVSIFSELFVIQKELINNISFGFLNYSCVNNDIYFVYGMSIGLQTKIIIAFKNDKPHRNEEPRNLCQKIFDFYIEDQLNPFNDILQYKPSDRLQSQVENLITDKQK